MQEMKYKQSTGTGIAQHWKEKKNDPGVEAGKISKDKTRQSICKMPRPSSNQQNATTSAQARLRGTTKMYTDSLVQKGMQDRIAKRPAI